MRRQVLVIVVGVLIATGCSTSDPTASEEYQALEHQLARAEAAVVAITAERDALSQTTVSGGRYDAALRVHNEIISVLDDPAAYGTEDEMADLLASHATPDALMDDDVFGAVDYRSGFYNTLFGMASAQIDVYDDWLCDDGSQGGFSWAWHGTNNAGNPFYLAGISLATHDEYGLISYELVTYPYSDGYVREAFLGSGN